MFGADFNHRSRCRHGKAAFEAHGCWVNEADQALHEEDQTRDGEQDSREQHRLALSRRASMTPLSRSGAASASLSRPQSVKVPDATLISIQAIARLPRWASARDLAKFGMK